MCVFYCRVSMREARSGCKGGGTALRRNGAREMSGGECAIEEFFIVQRKQAALSGLSAQGANKKGKQEGEALGKGEGKPYARKAPRP